jgi:hypothetical protein
VFGIEVMISASDVALVVPITNFAIPGCWSANPRQHAIADIPDALTHSSNLVKCSDHG